MALFARPQRSRAPGDNPHAARVDGTAADTEEERKFEGDVGCKALPLQLCLHHHHHPHTQSILARQLNATAAQRSIHHAPQELSAGTGSHCTAVSLFEADRLTAADVGAAASEVAGLDEVHVCIAVLCCMMLEHAVSRMKGGAGLCQQPACHVGI